jgi:hypothetical protein
MADTGSRGTGAKVAPGAEVREYTAAAVGLAPAFGPLFLRSPAD